MTEVEKVQEGESEEEEYGGDLAVPETIIERAVEAYSKQVETSLEVVRTQAEVRRYEIEQQSAQQERALRTTVELAKVRKDDRDSDRRKQQEMRLSTYRYATIGGLVFSLLIITLAWNGDGETVKLVVTSAASLLAGASGGYHKGKNDAKDEQKASGKEAAD